MTPHSVYFPVIMNPARLFRAKLGAQIEGEVTSQMKWMRPDRIGQWPLRWREVEEVRGVYAWPALYDANAEALEGYESIITIKCCPAWARLWDDVGSPPNPAYYGDLKHFIQLVQDRYHPTAIEFFNEPDVKRGEGVPDFFGAWVGTGEAWYQGGARYGVATAVIYPDLGSKLLAGALMMHDNSLDFLRGALDAGLKADAISYHCYIGNPNQYNRPLELAAQIEVLTNLPIILTETSVLGDEDTDELRQWQEDYLAQLLDNVHDFGIEVINWYTLANNCWKNSDLVRVNPKPVYNVWAGA